MALTDRQRAAVFARDKGICSFSGISLWILDYGTPILHHDWPDHVLPVSRGGKDVLENLVCASDFHNAKKLNNGADKAYLFAKGQPTEWFYWLYGELSEEQADMIRRHASLVESDWYFNRALSNVFIALQIDWNKATPVRTVEYWLRAAAKRLRDWRRVAEETDPITFVSRGLVRYPDAPDFKLMLEIAGANEVRLSGIYQRLYPHYKANADALSAFAAAERPGRRESVVALARENAFTTKPFLEMLQRNVARLQETR